MSPFLTAGFEAELLARLANGVAGRPAADPCITSLVYRVMRLRSLFVKLPNLKFANTFKGVIRQNLMLAKFTRYTVCCNIYRTF